jgi:N-acetyltransferase 10
MVRKKVDSRLRVLIENGVKQRHRSLFVVIGDKAREQVVNLHYILSKSQVKARPSVLWCYKDELGFVTNQRKQRRKIKREVQRGYREANKSDPFELFVASTKVRYVYYKDSYKVLGTTYGMCVLQDFEALTPNLLARAIETVEGGGIVVLLLKKMTSLTQVYNMSMDVHARFKSAAYQEIRPRFNERFILSLGMCKSCLVVDDELNILPISSHVKNIEKVNLSLVKLDPKSDTVRHYQLFIYCSPVVCVSNDDKMPPQA